MRKWARGRAATRRQVSGSAQAQSYVGLGGGEVRSLSGRWDWARGGRAGAVRRV